MYQILTFCQQIKDSEFVIKLPDDKIIKSTTILKFYAKFGGSKSFTKGISILSTNTLHCWDIYGQHIPKLCSILPTLNKLITTEEVADTFELEKYQLIDSEDDSKIGKIDQIKLKIVDNNSNENIKIEDTDILFLKIRFVLV